MRTLPAAAAFAVVATAAHADIPFFTAVCPEGPAGTVVEAREGGPVTIGGGAADILSESKYAFEARRGAVTVAVMIKPDGSLSVSYRGEGGAGGLCLVGAAGPVEHDEQL